MDLLEQESWPQASPECARRDRFTFSAALRSAISRVPACFVHQGSLESVKFRYSIIPQVAGRDAACFQRGPELVEPWILVSVSRMTPSRVSSIRRTQITSWRTCGSVWESLGWSSILTRRAGSSLADLPNRT